MQKSDLTRREERTKLFIALFVGALILIMYFPLYYMLISSTKDNLGILAHPFTPTLAPIWANYASSFSKIVNYLKNSIIIAVITVGGIFFTGTLAAYILARFDFPFKKALYALILSFLMIPGTLTLIPQFVLVSRLRLLGSYWAVILPGIAGGQITYIVYLRTGIENVPGDLFESAAIEGASHVQTFFYIVFPLIKPVILSLCLIAFMNSWNDFIWPLLTLSSNDSKKTIILGLYSYMDAQQTRYGPMYAGFVLASVPLVVLFTFNMRYFVNGITMGAVKG